MCATVLRAHTRVIIKKTSSLKGCAVLKNMHLHASSHYGFVRHNCRVHQAMSTENRPSKWEKEFDDDDDVPEDQKGLFKLY